MAGCEYVIAATEKANADFHAESGVLEWIPKNANVALEPSRGQRLEEFEDHNRKSPGCYQWMLRILVERTWKMGQEA